jgi:hypothetical protein
MHCTSTSSSVKGGVMWHGRPAIAVSLVLMLALLWPISGTSGTPKADQPGDNASGQPISSTANAPSVGEEINWQVFSAGGSRGTTTGMFLTSSLGQTAAGTGTTTGQLCHLGFLQNFSGDCCVGMTGNVDNDPTEFIDIGDLTALIDYLFITTAVPVCLAEANVDGSVNGFIDIGDVAALIDYLFITNAPPAPCP